MGAFATADDVRLRWAGAPANDGLIEAVLEDAAVWLRAWYPSIPAEPSDTLLSALRMVSVSMVKRSLLSADNGHLESMTDTAGPFSQARSFRNPEGNLFLTAQERTMLDRALGVELGRGSGMRMVEAEF